MFDKKKMEYYLLIFFAWVFKVIGLKNSRRFAFGFAFILFHIIPIRKKVVVKNLTLAFPEKSSDEIEKIAYKNFKSTMITFVEFLSFKSLSRKELLALGTVTEEESKSVYDADKLNNGGIYLTAHFGNWELGALWIGTNFNRSVHVLVKPQSNGYISDYIKSIREKFGNVSIKTGASVRELFQTIKNNGIAGVVGDQRGPEELRRVKFFNRDTAIYPGTAAIGLKTRAPLFVMLFLRGEDFTYKGIVERISYDNLPENKEDQIHEITQRYISILEKYVRQYPEQYFWMHNIWKY